MPASLVIVSRFTPVSELESRILAPPTAAPEGSFTVPLRVAPPISDWAKDAAASARTHVPRVMIRLVIGKIVLFGFEPVVDEGTHPPAYLVRPVYLSRFTK